MQDLGDAFDEHGQLRSRLRRKGRLLSNRDAIGLAALFAYVRGQREAVAFLLEKDGNWNMTGVNNGTMLHRAAVTGDLTIVKQLVAKGADTSNRDNPFAATPLSWADHGKQSETFDWLRNHSSVDLHDAVGFGLTEHVHARLHESPASVNEQRDQWQLAQATPLHVAAMMDRVDLAGVLLDAGADPTVLAGNGLSPLEVAEQNNAKATVALLQRRP
jgi:ankyrin repeat protein